MPSEAAILLLFTLAAMVAVAARWLRIPYTVALVLAGLVTSGLHVVEAPHLTQALLYSIFLPGLLFEAAFHMEFRAFWRNKMAISALALPGVAMAIALTGGLATALLGALLPAAAFTLTYGLVFGALIAATDPIAVVALFKSLGAPKRLAVLVEGESLLNDGTAVVMLTLILGITGGKALSLPGAIADFVAVAGMGTVVGLAIGYAASLLTQRIEDPMVEITLTTVAAYGSFLLAEHFHYSGVMATVAAGIVCGNVGAATGMSPTTRIAVASFWAYVAFALNSLVFLLIGFEIRLDALLRSWPLILAVFAAVTLSRALVVGAVTAAVSRTAEKLPWSWAAVMIWGGLRGSLSMVLALALPPVFPHRELLITMTFGVVALSILVQGLTMSPLLRRLGLAGKGQNQLAYEIQRGRLLATQAMVHAIERLKKDRSAHPEVLTAIEHECLETVHGIEAELSALHMEEATLREEEVKAVRRQALIAKKDAVLHAFHRGLIGQESYDILMQETNAALLEQEASDH